MEVTGNHGIIAKVKKETRKHRTGQAPGEGEDDTDESEQADEAPVYPTGVRASVQRARRHQMLAATPVRIALEDFIPKTGEPRK